jgi:hypothetical protein
MMNALLALAPRVAGTELMEPATEFTQKFDETVGDLHDAAICYLTSDPSACCLQA